MSLLAIFPDQESARAALRVLGPLEHEVYSAEPMDVPHVKNDLLKAAVLGGLLGGLGGMALAVYTFKTMNLHTGGMAMVTYPPTGIVVFAVSALSAIGSALATLLWEGDMLHLRPALPEEVRREVAEGAVAITAPEASRETLEMAGAKIRTL